MENMEKFDHSVKKWLQDAKICRECGTLMDWISGGVYGEYKPEGINNSYHVASCPKCKLQLKEVTKREWAHRGEFKELKK